MKFSRQLIAALLLLAWLGAGAHVAIEHGGMGFGSNRGDAVHEAPDSGGDGHHHHDLGAARPAHLIKASAQPDFAPIFDRSCVAPWALRSGAAATRGHSTAAAPPLDERAFGWLLAVHAAHPVRGPSLAA